MYRTELKSDSIYEYMFPYAPFGRNREAFVVLKNTESADFNGIISSPLDGAVSDGDGAQGGGEVVLNIDQNLNETREESMKRALKGKVAIESGEALQVGESSTQGRQSEGMPAFIWTMLLLGGTPSESRPESPSTDGAGGQQVEETSNDLMELLTEQEILDEGIPVIVYLPTLFCLLLLIWALWEKTTTLSLCNQLANQRK